MAIQLRRGTNAQWEALKSNIVVGELATTYDSERAFLGTGNGTYFEMANIELIADEFDSSVSYAEGGVCIYQGKLYQFTANHSGAWSGTDVEQVTASEVGSGGTAISDLQDNALIHRTASGSIASFSDGSTMPMDSLIADINPIQSGSGDPSPTNVRAISGWDSVDVNVVGKNLVTSVENALLSGTGNGVLYQANASCRSVVFSCKEGQTYTVSGVTNNRFVYGFYDSMPSANEETTSFVSGSGSLPKTFTALKDGVCVVYLSNVAVDTSTAQVELGSTATAYEPYNGNTTTVSLGQTVYGGSLNVTSGELTIDRVLVDPSTLSWLYSATSSYALFYSNITTMLMGENGGTLLSDRFPYSTVNGLSAIPNKAMWNKAWGISRNNLIIRDDDYTTATDFKNSLVGSQIVYYLATPTTVQLTPTQVNSLLGQNNVWADSGNVEVTYKANASLTIEEIINAITSLGGNV